MTISSARPPHAAAPFTPEEQALLAEFFPLELAQRVLTADPAADALVRGGRGRAALEKIATDLHGRRPWPVPIGVLVVDAGCSVMPRGAPGGVWIPSTSPQVRAQVATLVAAAQLAGCLLAPPTVADGPPRAVHRADAIQLATNLLLPAGAAQSLTKVPHDPQDMAHAYALAPWRVVHWRREQFGVSHERPTEAGLAPRGRRR